jgi:hypothetical protein
MIDKDDFTLVSQFYKNINDAVTYKEDIQDALKKLIKDKDKPFAFDIIPTKVRISEENDESDNFHAVCLVLFEGIIYFFDPNGVIPNPNLFFVYKNTLGNLEWLTTKEYLDKFNKSIVYIKKEGPQMFTKSVKYCQYINEGGYCMFYIYVFIKYLWQLHEKNLLTEDEIKKIFNHNYSEKDILFFPNEKEIEDKSKEIIDSIREWDTIPSKKQRTIV